MTNIGLFLRRQLLLKEARSAAMQKILLESSLCPMDKDINDLSQNYPSPAVKTRYYLGDKYPNIYFTEQEFRCITYLVIGKTYKEIANIIGLSHRTVGFYFSNIRYKLKCRSKRDLMYIVKNTELNKSQISP